MEVVFRRHGVAVVHRREAEPNGVLCPVHGVDRTLERVVRIRYDVPTGLGDVPSALVEMPNVGVSNGVFHMVSVAVHVELGGCDGVVGMRILAVDVGVRRERKGQVEAGFALAVERH